MMETVLFLVVFLLSVIGLSELIHGVWIALIKPKTKQKKILLCVLCGDLADLQLKSAYEEMIWHGRSYADELIGVELTVDEQVLKRCKEFAECKDIKIIKKNELNGVLDGEQCRN